MDPVIISWTPTNWITIFLMVLGGFLLLKVAFMGVNMVRNKGAANA